MTGRPPAMTDVAALAGVSHQTVSRVLNGHPNVKAATRDRVSAAIAELGYRPNRAAKALATGRTQLFGVIAQRTTLFGPAAVLTAFDAAAAGAGFGVSVALLPRLDEPALVEAVGRLLDQGVAGIAAIAPVESARVALAAVPADVPLVAVDGGPGPGAPVVTVDQELGARLAVRHLLAAGHRTVWHVAGPDDWFDARGRVRGWRAELAASRIAPPPLLTGDWTAASGYAAGRSLAADPDVTAVFAANDHMALGIYRALAEAGRAVPGDVSVVGFDDVPESAYFVPPLTTVRPDFAAVAVGTLDILLTGIDGGPIADRVVVAPELVERSSVRTVS